MSPLCLGPVEMDLLWRRKCVFIINIIDKRTLLIDIDWIVSLFSVNQKLDFSSVSKYKNLLDFFLIFFCRLLWWFFFWVENKFSFLPPMTFVLILRSISRFQIKQSGNRDFCINTSSSKRKQLGGKGSQKNKWTKGQNNFVKQTAGGGGGGGGAKN